MKGIKMAKDYKRWMTIEEMEISKRIIEDMKEDESSVKDLAEYAAREALGNDGYLREIVTASAEIARNSRIFDRYFEGSNHIDIWITALVEADSLTRDARGEMRSRKGYMEIGAYLSDIWETGAKEYRHHMYIERFLREEDR